jgi:hypothetical protein
MECIDCYRVNCSFRIQLGEKQQPMLLRFLQNNPGISIFMGFGSVSTWFFATFNPALQMIVLLLTTATLIMSLKKSYKKRKSND